MEVETNKSAGFAEVITAGILSTSVKDYWVNGNIQVKENTVKDMQLGDFSEMSMQSNNLIMTSDNNSKAE